MPAPLYTSSSNPAHSPTPTPSPAAKPTGACLARVIRRSPRALLIAVGLGILLHACAAFIYSTPVARADLRGKVRTLTQNRRPCVLIAGDSRFESGIVPDVLARELGLPSRKVINMAETACDTPAVLAAYNEFADRFDTDHLMVLDLSFFGANDGATDILGSELLWNLGFKERVRLAGPGRALRTCFLPEKAAWEDLLRYWPADNIAGESGFEGVPANVNLKSWSPAYLEQRVAALAKWWYSNLNIDGTRWQQLCLDLQSLKSSRAKLVVVLMPYHPAFLKAIDQTAAGEAEKTFRIRVTEVCSRLDIPCLNYQSDCLQAANPDELFHDLIHLNRAGALAFTPVLARDLAVCGVPSGTVDRLARK